MGAREHGSNATNRVCPECSTPVRLVPDAGHPQYGWCVLCESWVVHIQAAQP